MGTSMQNISGEDEKEVFVFPWTGIIVNIQTELKDGHYVGPTATELENQFKRIGFTPNKVQPLFNKNQDHSGAALVEFGGDWSGFHRAMSFEKAYEAHHCGKKDWQVKKHQNSDLYGWIARVDDYASVDIIGENLCKIGDLRTVSDIMEEEARNVKRLVGNLKNVIEEKSIRLLEIEAEDRFQKISNEYRQLKLQAEINKGKIDQLEKDKQALELEVEKFRAKSQELEELEVLNQTLVVQERRSNDELQDSRKELITEVIMEDDAKVSELKENYGDEVYNAVVNDCWS